MAPFRNDASGSQKITSFFSRFIIPRERRPDPNSIGDEIVVAPPGTATRRSSQQSARSPTSSQRDSSATKKRKLSDGVPAATAPLSTSANAGSSTPRREGGMSPESAYSPSTSRQAGEASAWGDRSTHTQSPLQHNISPLDVAADVTPAKDSPHRERAGSSSNPRLSTAAQISLPLSPKAPTPSPLTDRTRHASPKGLHGPDFQTTTARVPTKIRSSFSTSVGSSATSTNALRSSTSSRRIVKDGLKAIANSDSDMTDDSSGEELADPSSFFAKKRKISSEPVKAVVAPKVVRLSDGSRQTKTADLSTKSPPKKVYKRSLASLSRERQKMLEAQAKIASMQQAVEESKMREEQATRQEALGLHIETDPSAFLEWASDDEDGERTLKALQRVEALHAIVQYYFFLDTEPLFEKSPFPVNVLPDEPWAKLYATDTSREQVCISGLAAEMAVHFPIPMAITNWMAQQLLHEQNEALCEAYAAILEASSEHYESLSDTIASLSSMYKTRSLFENKWKDPVRRGLPAGLKYMLQVVRFGASTADNVEAPPLKTIEAFLDFAMMNLDDLVKKDIALSMTLTKCIEELINALPDKSFDQLLPGILAMLDESEKDIPLQLRCRLIAALPSRTTRSYALRRQLALDIFLPHRDDRAKATSADWDWLEAICKSLKSKEEFDITDSTDYDLLIALLEASNIAVSAGFTDFNELHPYQDPARKNASGVYIKPPPLSQAARNHNSQIDAIVPELEYMKSRIQHESTSLCRQEVKAVLERVTARLETSVRTRPKPKKSVFGTKQARFAKDMLRTVPDARDESVVAGDDATDRPEDPPTPSIDEELPDRPGIDDFESSPVQIENQQALTPNVDDEMAIDEVASSSDDFHTAYDISQPRD